MRYSLVTAIYPAGETYSYNGGDFARAVKKSNAIPKKQMILTNF
jgi:hypothetical protein